MTYTYPQQPAEYDPAVHEPGYLSVYVWRKGGGEVHANPVGDGSHVLRGPDGTVLGTFTGYRALEAEVERRWPTPPEEIAAEKAYEEGQDNAFIGDYEPEHDDDGEETEPSAALRAHWARMESDKDYAAGVRDARANAADYEREREWLAAKMTEL